MERKVKYKYKMFLFGSISILFLFGIAGCQKRDSQQEEQKSPNQAETKVEQENQAQSESLEEELEKIFLEEVYGTKEFYVESEEIARKILKLQGEALRKDLEENSQVREIESYLENTYGIEAVNLQNMDLELAQSVQTACDYMYGKYPILQKYLTNIIVQEQISESDSAIAKYEMETFLTNPDESQLYPFVIKKQILLREQEFYNPKRLQNLITRSVREGHWPEGTSVESIMVHELAHCLVDCLISREYGLNNSIYITEENGEAFSQCATQDLSSSQEYVKALCQEAYEKYLSQYNKDCTYEEFCLEISSYGQGLQEDGGTSYEETVAEAMADVYIHEEQCSDASRVIVDVINSRIAEKGM